MYNTYSHIYHIGTALLILYRRVKICLDHIAQDYSKIYLINTQIQKQRWQSQEKRWKMEGDIFEL